MIGLVQRLHAGNLIDHAKLQVILQVLSDAGPVEHDRKAEVEQVAPRSDTGEKQKLRRADRSGREDHLALGLRSSARAILPPGDAGGAPAIELDTLGKTTGLDPQV